MKGPSASSAVKRLLSTRLCRIQVLYASTEPTACRIMYKLKLAPAQQQCLVRAGRGRRLAYLAVAGEKLGAAEKREDLVVAFLHHVNLAPYHVFHSSRHDIKGQYHTCPLTWGLYDNMEARL